MFYHSKPCPFPRHLSHGEWTLTVRTDDKSVRGHALILALHPYSEDWIDSSRFRPTLRRSRRERSARYAATTEDDEHWKASADAMPFDPFETHGDYLRAVLRGPRRAAPKLETGRTFWEGENRGKDGESKVKGPLMHWGLCPLPPQGLELVVQTILGAEYLQALLRLVTERPFDVGYSRRGGKDQPTKPMRLGQPSIEVAPQLLEAAVWKSLAGPRCLAQGPRGRSWSGVPVAVLAGFAFMESLDRFNRFLKRHKKERRDRGGAGVARQGQENVFVDRPTAYTDQDWSEQARAEFDPRDATLWYLLYDPDYDCQQYGMALAEVLSEPPNWACVASHDKEEWLKALRHVQKNGSAVMRAKARSILEKLEGR